MRAAEARMIAAANRLAKWRTIFAGWQLGTRPNGDPEGDAVRDHREATLLLRAEVSGHTRLLVEVGLISRDRVVEVMTEEYDALSDMLADRFPGARATDEGMQLDRRFIETTQGWRP